MRYYVVTRESSTSRRYIVAETVREEADTGEHRDTSVASAIAGEHADILTDEEISSTSEGVAMLRSWNLHNDDVFNDETRMLQHEDFPLTSIA
ncbi:MAG: hypothetical protein WAT66_15545 [Actinomycetota bacterium]